MNEEELSKRNAQLDEEFQKARRWWAERGVHYETKAEAIEAMNAIDAGTHESQK